MGRPKAPLTIWLAVLVVVVALLPGCTNIVDTVIYRETIPTGGRVRDISISGNNLVWVESYEVEHSLDFTYEMKLYNLETHSSRTIAFVGNVDIGGDTVVWNEYTEGTGLDIWAYDLVTQERYAICEKEGDQSYPRIAGNYVVWREEEKQDKATHWNYYTYDLTSGEIQPVIFQKIDHSSYAPQFKGDIIAWRDIAWLYGNWFGYYREPVDTDGKTSIWIDKSPTSSLWTEERAGDIIAYNYETNSEVRLPRTWAYVHEIAISGDLIVWTQGQGGGSHLSISPDVYGYNLATGKKFAISNDNTNKSEIAIDNNIVVWAEPGYLQIVEIKPENLD
jgi:hypothetical protein